MPQKRRRIVFLGGALCVVLSLMGGIVAPLNTQGLSILFVYEMSMIASILLIMLFMYKKGFTE